jgi:hypothetical protein
MSSQRGNLRWKLQQTKAISRILAITHLRRTIVAAVEWVAVADKTFQQCSHSRSHLQASTKECKASIWASMGRSDTINGPLLFQNLLFHLT